MEYSYYKAPRIFIHVNKHDNLKQLKTIGDEFVHYRVRDLLNPRIHKKRINNILKGKNYLAATRHIVRRSGKIEYYIFKDDSKPSHSFSKPSYTPTTDGPIHRSANLIKIEPSIRHSVTSDKVVKDKLVQSLNDSSNIQQVRRYEISDMMYQYSEEID
jgi:hypothetical protein